MTFHFRPARRENTPLIVGLAGPTKSGKTMSALRLATGMADGGPIAMINAEGAKGRQYADRFTYVDTDIAAPFRPERYTEALKAALAIEPAVVILDSMSHMHDGPGGMLEYHADELQRLAGNDERARRRNNWTAWIKPKAAENEFIYTLLSADAHVVLCFRAKEKLKIIPGQDPVDLGWQPIASDRIAFETLFTLVLPPHSKGVPDIALSDMREPFDVLVPSDQPLSEATGRLLLEWAKGSGAGAVDGTEQPAADRKPSAPDEPGASSPSPASVSDVHSQGGAPDHLTGDQRDELDALFATLTVQGAVTIGQLYAAMAAQRNVGVDTMREVLAQSMPATDWWERLRDSLTVDEAAVLITRLRKLEADQPQASMSPTGERGASGF